jgi:hypothetical protein
VFEGKKPYIYHGPNDYYDAGGQLLRKAFMQDPPKYNKSKRVNFFVTKETEDFLLGLLGHAKFTEEGLYWIANLPLTVLRGYEHETYIALKIAGLGAFIPIDNRELVLGVGK